MSFTMVKKNIQLAFVALAAAALLGSAARADEYDDAIKSFKEAGQSADFFDNSYAYVVLPSIGKAGFVVGGAHGDGKAYVGGKHVGNVTMTKLSVGLQAGAQAYSQIIFFEDKAAFEKFSSSEFEFGASASAVLITLGATAEAGTTGASASASTKHDEAATAGKYVHGMAVFNVVKGGAMYEASLAGQKYKYEAL